MSRPLPVSHPRALLFDLDPGLPGMVRALNSADVAARFEREWPQAGRSPSITGCDLQHVRWTPGVECMAIYRLELDDAAKPIATLGVVVITPDTLHHRLFAEDAELPGLTAAADPAVMTVWLAERLGRSIDSCSIAPVSYEPGEACVLRYELEDRKGTVLYGRVTSGERAETVAGIVRSLGDRFVAAVVGVAPELQLVVHQEAGTRSLGAVAESTVSADTLRELRGGGRLLARLHARFDPAGPSRSLVEDAGELEQYLDVSEWVSPPTAALLAEGIDRARAQAGGAAPLVPSHGAFHLGRVHLTARGPRFIDLDSFCWSDPARDLGSVLAHLRWLAIRRPESRSMLARVRTAFLAGYRSKTVAPLDEDRLAAFEGVSLLRIAGRGYRNLAFEEWERVPELVGAALSRLGAGGG